jgi:hypothetical protein
MIRSDTTPKVKWTKCGDYDRFQDNLRCRGAGNRWLGFGAPPGQGGGDTTADDGQRLGTQDLWAEAASPLKSLLK